MTDEQWYYVVDTDLTGLFRLCREVAQALHDTQQLRAHRERLLHARLRLPQARLDRALLRGEGQAST